MRGTLSICALVMLSGCSDKTHGSSSSDTSCSVQFSGNTTDSETVPSCGALSVAEDAGLPDYSLNFQVKTAKIPSFASTIDLGPAPTPGVFSSETASTWSVTGTVATSCALLAGTAAARMGSFTLTLTSLSLSGAIPADADAGAADADTSDASAIDAGATQASVANPDTTGAGAAGKLHGTLDLTAYVEETPGMACGVSDAELVHIDF